MIKFDHTSQEDFIQDLYCFYNYKAYNCKTYLYQKRWIYLYQKRWTYNEPEETILDKPTTPPPPLYLTSFTIKLLAHKHIKCWSKSNKHKIQIAYPYNYTWNGNATSWWTVKILSNPSSSWSLRLDLFHLKYITFRYVSHRCIPWQNNIKAAYNYKNLCFVTKKSN